MINKFNYQFIIIIIFLIILKINVSNTQTTTPTLTPIPSDRPVLPSNRPPPITKLACNLNTCSLLGQPCNPKETPYSGVTCYVQDRCLNGTCVKSLGQDEECMVSEECDLGFSCVTFNSTLSYTLPNKTKTCQPSFFSDFDEPCKRSTDCINSLDCLGGVCTTPEYGCLSDLSCRNDSICVNGTCIVTPLVNNQCFMFRSDRCPSTKNHNPCALTSFNISSIGVCLEEIPVGNPCLTTKYSCNWKTDQVCRPLFPGSTVGRCVNVPKEVVNSCITKANCRPYELCKCDQQSGVGYCATRGIFFGRYCLQAAQLFYDCLRDVNCSQPYSLNPTSCILKSKCRGLATCVSEYCTKPLLPIELCSSVSCDISIFNDSSVRNISISIKIKPNLILIIILIIILIKI